MCATTECTSPNGDIDCRHIHRTDNFYSQNSLNGHFNNNRGISLRTDDHVMQVIADRRQITVSNNNRKTINVGTWDARTLYQAGKVKNLIQYMDGLDINIFELCETRLNDSRRFQLDDFNMPHSGSCKYEIMSCDTFENGRFKIMMDHRPISETHLTFQLFKYMLQRQPFRKRILTHYNSHQRKQDSYANHRIVHKIIELLKQNHLWRLGLGKRPERCETFVTWCQANEQVITYTCFVQHPRKQRSWKVISK